MCGELKHGPLALVDEHLPSILVMPPDPVREVRHINALLSILILYFNNNQ
jgi:glucosamine 6-phosphate synthetase-like amidotransferase/phosphosugar isomerase protein